MALASVVTIAVACHDAATNPLAPVSAPALNVSSDGIWTVNSLTDPGDGVCSSNECTLREAIAAAQPGDGITFKGNLSGTIALNAGTLVIDKTLTIEGPGAGTLAVNGQNVTQVFQIGTFTSAVIVTLGGLTITGGNALPGAGGGIRVWAQSRLALIASVVTRNTALSGGGIQNDGMLTLVRSTVSFNRATTLGGGIYALEAISMTRSTISGNRADAQGGAIYLSCGTGCDVAAIRSSTITDNDATAGGGVSLGGPTTVWNTIIAGNRAGGSPNAPSADCIAAINVSSLGYNLSTLGTGCALGAATDVVVADPSVVFSLVLSPVLADNGGSTPTHALLERGFAVDAGYCPGETVDQRAFPRPYDDLRMPNAVDACDIGAFEWQPTDTKKNPKP